MLRALLINVAIYQGMASNANPFDRNHSIIHRVERSDSNPLCGVPKSDFVNESSVPFNFIKLCSVARDPNKNWPDKLWTSSNRPRLSVPFNGLPVSLLMHYQLPNVAWHDVGNPESLACGQHFPQVSLLLYKVGVYWKNDGFDVGYLERRTFPDVLEGNLVGNLKSPSLPSDGTRWLNVNGEPRPLVSNIAIMRFVLVSFPKALQPRRMTRAARLMDSSII